MRAHRQRAARPGTIGPIVALVVAMLSTAPALSATAGAAGKMSDGVERIIAELRAREAALVAKESDLEARERSIAALEGQVQKRFDELDLMRAEVESRIEDWSSSGGNRVERLAKVYSEMPPNKAAPLLQGLERDLATSILSHMKEKKSAAVFAAMPKADALLLSSRYARPLASEAGKKP